MCDDQYKKLSVLESGTAPATTVSTSVYTTWCYNWVSISSTTRHPDSTLSRLNTPSDIISLNVFLKFIDLRTIKSCFRTTLQLLFCFSCSPLVRTENLNLEQNYGLVLSSLDIFEPINVQRAFWKCIGISKPFVFLFSKTVWKYTSFVFAYAFYFFFFSHVSKVTSFPTRNSVVTRQFLVMFVKTKHFRPSVTFYSHSVLIGPYV